MVNLIDSEIDNERLVVIWNAIEDKTTDPDIKDYAHNKRVNLQRLREAKRESDINKNGFDLKYAELIEREMKEVQDYEEEGERLIFKRKKRSKKQNKSERR